MTVTDLNAWKEKGQRKWGPLANLSRVEAIFEACAHLEQTQQELNRANVRDLIGGGSDRDIGPVIKLYKDLQASRQKEALELVPDTVVQIIAVEVENQLQKIKRAYDDQVIEEKTLFENSANELSATVETLEHEKDALKHTLEEKDDRIRALNDELGKKEEAITQLQEQVKALDNQYNIALRKNEELTQKLVEKDKTISANEEKHKDALAVVKQEAKAQREELTAQHDKEIDRLMTQLGNERGEWRQEKKEFKTDIATLQITLQERQKTIDSQSVNIVQLNKDVLEQAEELILLKTTEEDRHALHDQLDAAIAENKSLQDEIDRLHQQIPKQQELISQITAIQKTLVLLQQKKETDKKTATKSKTKRNKGDQ